MPKIWDAGLNVFVKHIIKAPIEDHVIAAILTLIRTERDGYTIDRSSVKGCVDVFLQLYITSGRESISAYKHDLEPAVLKESEAFYKREGERLLETCDAPEYLKRVSLRMCASRQEELTDRRFEHRWRRAFKRKSRERTTSCRRSRRSRCGRFSSGTLCLRTSTPSSICLTRAWML